MIYFLLSCIYLQKHLFYVFMLNTDLQTGIFDATLLMVYQSLGILTIYE